MHESMISTGKVFAGVLWTWVGGLMLSGWVIMVSSGSPGYQALANGLFAMACVSSALAAVLHIRCYFVRQAHLIRAMSDRLGEVRDSAPPSRMRSVPPQHTR